MQQQWMMSVIIFIVAFWVWFIIFESKDARYHKHQMQLWVQNVWNQPTKHAINHLMHPDVKIHTNIWKNTFPMTRNDLKQFHQRWFQQINNTKITILSLSYTRPWVALAAQVNGTSRRTNRLFGFKGIVWAQFKNRRIIEVYENWQNVPNFLF